MIDYIILGIITVVAIVLALISLGLSKRIDKRKREQETFLEGILEATEQGKTPEERIKICRETREELEKMNSDYTKKFSEKQFEDLFYSSFATAHSIRLRKVTKQYGPETAYKLYIGNFVLEKAKNKSKEFRKEVRFYKKHKEF